jgi:hypothetical protein
MSGEVLDYGDASVVGLQEGKELVHSFGDTRVRTAHEHQGSRADIMIVYLDPAEVFFYASHVAHFRVAISRARYETLFVVRPMTAVRNVPGVIFGGLNGKIEFSCLSRFSPLSYVNDLRCMDSSLFEKTAERDVFDVTSGGLNEEDEFDCSSRIFPLSCVDDLLSVDSTLHVVEKDEEIGKDFFVEVSEVLLHVVDSGFLLTDDLKEVGSLVDVDERLSLLHDESFRSGGLNGKSEFDYLSRISPLSYVNDLRSVDSTLYVMERDEEIDEALSCRDADVFMEDFFVQVPEVSSHVVDGVSLSMDDLKEADFVVDVDERLSLLRDEPFRRFGNPVEDGESYVVSGRFFPVLHQWYPRSGLPTVITSRDRLDALTLTKRLFHEIVDRKSFIELFEVFWSNGCYDAKTKNQVRHYLEAPMGDRPSTVATTFIKDSPPKKTQSLPKFQNVTSSSDLVQGVFANVVAALTGALVRSVRSNVTIDAFLTDDELFVKLADATAAMEHGLSAEFDLTAQDSTHMAIHIAVFSEILREAAVPQEIIDAFELVRAGERIVSLDGTFVATSSTALTSGAPWTLIGNIIMMLTSLVNFYHIPRTAKVLQKGDDFSSSEKLLRRKTVCPMELVSWKEEAHAILTFTGKAAIEDVRIRKLGKFFVKAATQPRTSEIHASYQQALAQFAPDFANVDYDTWTAARYHLFGIDPEYSFDLVAAAFSLISLPYDRLPRHLRKMSSTPVRSKVVSTESKCVYHAVLPYLSADDVVTAYDRLYMDDVRLWDAVQFCVDFKLKYVVHDRLFTVEDLSSLVVDEVALFRDHAATRVSRDVRAEVELERLAVRFSFLL